MQVNASNIFSFESIKNVENKWLFELKVSVKFSGSAALTRSHSSDI